MPALLFLGLLLSLQLIEGTDPNFAILMMLAQVFGVLAFNTLGGMSHLAGSICLLSLLPNATVPELAHGFRAIALASDFGIRHGRGVRLLGIRTEGRANVPRRLAKGVFLRLRRIRFRP